MTGERIDEGQPPNRSLSDAHQLRVILWRIDETRFEVAVFRSLADSFWRWLTGAAAMAGLTLHRPDQVEAA